MILLNIIILLLTAFVTILPFWGSLTDKRKKGVNILTTKGKLFALSIFLLLAFGILKEVKVNEEEEIKEERTVSFQSKVDTITNKVQNLDSLNQQLDAVHFNTLQAIKERERFLEEFTSMNDKIKSLTDKEQQKFESGHPEVNFFQEPFFTIFDSTTHEYSLKFILMNNGYRTAKNIEISPIIFNSSNYKILNHLEIGKLRRATNPTLKIPSFEKSNLTFEVFYDNIVLPNNEKIENLKNVIYLAVKIKYSDFVTNKNFSQTEYFVWSSYNKNKYEFNRCSAEAHNKVLEYMDKNNINI